MAARYDDLDTKTIGLASVVSAIVLLILILAGRAVAYTWAAVVEDGKIQHAKYEQSDQVIASQKEVLTEFSRIEIPADKEKPATSRIVIPVERAYDLMREDLTPKPST